MLIHFVQVGARQKSKATFQRLLGTCQFQLDVTHIVALLALACTCCCLLGRILSLKELLEVYLVLSFARGLFGTLNTFH